MFARSKYGGDCAAIELYVMHSLLNAVAKINTFFENPTFLSKKSDSFSVENMKKGKSVIEKGKIVFISSSRKIRSPKRNEFYFPTKKR